MKILNVNEVLDAAAEALPAREYAELEDAVVHAVDCVGGALAESLATRIHDVSNQPGFAGLCVTFCPWDKDQRCPRIIDEGDPSGEWELPQGEARR